MHIVFFFFFQAEDGIRDVAVTGVQTCALPIYAEAGGVRRGNQLFGVRAFLPLDPRRARVRTVERAAAGLEVPFPVLELAFPDRHRLTRGHRPASAEGESRKSGGTAQGTLRLGRAST